MRTIGWIIFALASLIGLYALVGFDTSVPTAYGERVNNIGLMQERQNLLIASCAGVIVGLLMALLSKTSSESKAEVVRFERAISNNDLDTMRKLIASNQIDPNGRGPSGVQCWLRYAVVERKPEAFELLLRSGADPKVADGYGYSIVEYLAEVATANNEMSVMLKMCSNEELLNEGAAARQARLHPAQSEKAFQPNIAQDDVATRLTQLNALRLAGALTDEEFDEAKRMVLKRS